MSIFLTYGLTLKNKQTFILLSSFFSISIVLLMFLNNSEFAFYYSGSTHSSIAIYLTYFALSCVFYLIFNLLSIFFNYTRFTHNPYHSYGANFKLLLSQKDSLLIRIATLKKIYHSMITPSQSFLGNLEKNKKQYKYMKKQIGSREHAKDEYKELIRIESRLKGEQPLLKSDAHLLYSLAFFHEYDRLIDTFNVNKKNRP